MVFHWVLYLNWLCCIIFCCCFPPRSAFFLFCSEHRPKIKSDHPGLSIGDTAKKLGEMWSEQSAKDKLPFEQKAAKLKEKYEKVNKTTLIAVVGVFVAYSSNLVTNISS